jgi:hypothetical protein
MQSIPSRSRSVKPSNGTTPRKAERSFDLLAAPTPTMPGILQITQGKLTTDYFLHRLPSDFGTAFRLVKLLGEHTGYDVLLSPDGRHTCECMGALRWGHCKHVSALTALRAHGKL